MSDGAKCTRRHVDGDADDAFLACLEDTLWWRHAAPTAPDTLPSYPFKDGDPFVLEDPPDILISGAAPAFATSLASTKAGEACARLVCLPSFAETGVCAVLDLETLAVERLCFDDGMDEDAPSRRRRRPPWRVVGFSRAPAPVYGAPRASSWPGPKICRFCQNPFWTNQGYIGPNTGVRPSRRLELCRRPVIAATAARRRRSRAIPVAPGPHYCCCGQPADTTRSPATSRQKLASPK